MTISTAEQSQDTSVYIAGDSPATLSITAVSRAVQAVITATNTLAVNDVVRLGSIVGMEELLDEVAVVTARNSTSFTIDIDTSDFPTDGAAGSAEVPNWIEVGNVKDSNGFDGTTSDIDVTHLRSRAMEYRPGLEDFGNISLSIDIDNANEGHLAMRKAKRLRTVKPFKIVLPSGAVRAFQGYVKKFSEAVAVNSVVRGAVDIRITGSVAFGAPQATVSGPDLRPRWAVGTATQGTVAGTGAGQVGALFASATRFGNNNSRAGTMFALAATNYVWVFVLASAAPAGVSFRDDASGFSGGFNGALSAGAFSGAGANPCTIHAEYTDAEGNVWKAFRSDESGAYPSASSVTLS